MGKKQDKKQATIKDPLTFPIKKDKTFQKNLDLFLKMMHAKFSKISTIQYLRFVHRYIAKCRDNLKRPGSQRQIVHTLQKIKICKACDQWAKIKQKIVQCQICQDYYHRNCTESWDQDFPCCLSCRQILNRQSPRSSISRRSLQQNYCAKCANKNNKKITSKAEVKCMKCSLRYHRQCFGKKNQVVCYDCHQTIEREINQLKQSTLLQHGFKRTSSSKKETRQKKSQLSFSNIKQKYQQQYTQASSFIDKNFRNQFPKMTQQEVKTYKKDLLYAIYSKNMEYSEKLKPIDCSIEDDNQNSLDFQIRVMCPSDFAFYKKYKQQPIGPFKLIHRQKMGYDVIAAKNLPKGMIVCEYIGDVVTLRQALKDRHNDSLMEYKIGRNSDETLYIRPKKFTNIARFINGINNNRPQTANVKSLRALVQGKPAIILFTLKAVKQGQSLLYDYNGGQKSTYPTEDFI